jgi:hypothetical protein
VRDDVTTVWCVPEYAVAALDAYLGVLCVLLGRVIACPDASIVGVELAMPLNDDAQSVREVSLFGY